MENNNTSYQITDRIINLIGSGCALEYFKKVIADLDEFNVDMGNSILMYTAIDNSRPDIANYLLDLNCSLRYSDSFLNRASRKGLYELVKRIIDLGGNYNYDEFLRRLVIENKRDIIEKILSKSKTERGTYHYDIVLNKCLFQAICVNDMTYIDYFIDKGVDIENFIKAYSLTSTSTREFISRYKKLKELTI